MIFSQIKMYSETAFLNSNSVVQSCLLSQSNCCMSNFTPGNVRSLSFRVTKQTCAAIRFQPRKQWIVTQPRPQIYTLSNPTEATTHHGTRMAVETYVDGPKFSDLFPEDVLVYDTDDSAYRLNRLVNANHNGPTVVVWLRDYGCSPCRDQVTDISALFQSMNNVRIILIVSGTSEQAKKFIQDTGFTGELYSDPLRKSYAALSIKKKAQSILNSIPVFGKVLYTMPKSEQQRFQTTPCDPFLQGGCMLVNPHGQVKLLHRDDYVGDNINLDLLMQLCF